MPEASSGTLGAPAIPDVVAEEHTASRALIMRSRFDDFHAQFAKRHEAAAAIVRESPSVVDAMIGSLRWIRDYCKANNLEPHEVKLRGSLSTEGAIILQLSPIAED